MSTNTTNYNLKKPTEGVDPFLLEDWNDNFDKIDTEIKNGRDSDNTTNSSTVTGSKVSDAFDTLKEGIDTISSSDTNASIGVYHMRDIDNTDTYTGTFTGLALSTGLRVNLQVTNTNIGASSFNLNGGGAVDIKVNTKYGTQRDVYPEEIWGITELIYDGTYWVLFDEKRAIGSDELSQEKSVYSTGVGIDSSNADQDYQDVLEDSFSKFELEGFSVVNSVFVDIDTAYTPDGNQSLLKPNASDGVISRLDTYNVSKQIINATINDKWFIYGKVDEITLDGRIGMQYSDGTLTLGGIGFLDNQNEVYDIITVTKTLLANPFMVNNGEGDVTSTTPESFIAINLTALGLGTYFTSKGYSEAEQEAIMLDWVRNGYFEGIANNKNPILSSVGKNLFDEIWEIGNFNFGDGSEGTATNWIRCANFIRVEPDTTYAISPNTTPYILQYDMNKGYIGYAQSDNITTDSNAHYIRFQLLYSSFDGVNAQFELGSSATTYEPYKNSISLLKDTELRSVPNNTRDRVYIGADGNVYLEQKIKEYALQSADITAVVNNTNTQEVSISKQTDSSIYNNGDSTLAKSQTHLINGFRPIASNAGDNADNIGGYYNRNTTTIRIAFATGTYADLPAAKTDLTGTIVHYELAEPIITNLTELLKANGSIQTFQNGTMYLEGFVEELFTTTGTSQVLTEDFAAVSNVYYLDGEVYSKLSSGTWTYTESTKTLSGLTNGETYRVEGSPSYFIPPTSTMTYALNTEARDDASASGANENKKEIASLSDALALIIANL